MRLTLLIITGKESVFQYRVNTCFLALYAWIQA